MMVVAMMVLDLVSTDYNLHLTVLNIQCLLPAVAQYQIKSPFLKSIYKGRQKTSATLHDYSDQVYIQTN